MYIGLTGSLRIGNTKIAYISGWNVEDTTEVIETTKVGQVYKEAYAGLQSWTASANGVVVFEENSDTVSSHELLFARKHAGKRVNLQLYLNDTRLRESSEKPACFVGEGYIETLSVDLTSEGAANISISIKGHGMLDVIVGTDSIKTNTLFSDVERVPAPPPVVVPPITVVDNLESDSSIYALSANMGRVLHEEVQMTRIRKFDSNNQHHQNSIVIKNNNLHKVGASFGNQYRFIVANDSHNGLPGGGSFDRDALMREIGSTGPMSLSDDDVRRLSLREGIVYTLMPRFSPPWRAVLEVIAGESELEKLLHGANRYNIVERHIQLNLGHLLNRIVQKFGIAPTQIKISTVGQVNRQLYVRAGVRHVMGNARMLEFNFIHSNDPRRYTVHNVVASASWGMTMGFLGFLVNENYPLGNRIETLIPYNNNPVDFAIEFTLPAQTELSGGFQS